MSLKFINTCYNYREDRCSLVESMPRRRLKILVTLVLVYTLLIFFTVDHTIFQHKTFPMTYLSVEQVCINRPEINLVD